MKLKKKTFQRCVKEMDCREPGHDDRYGRTREEGVEAVAQVSGLSGHCTLYQEGPRPLATFRENPHTATDEPEHHNRDPAQTINKQNMFFKKENMREGVKLRNSLVCV